MVNDDLDRRLSDLERQAGTREDGPDCVIIRASYEDLPDDYRLSVEPEDDHIDRRETVAVPAVMPPGYRSGVVVLDTEDVVRLWDTMPEDVKEKERSHRQERGAPVPPVLEGNE